MYVDEEDGHQAPQPSQTQKIKGDYQDYYNRIKAMAAEKKWTDQQFQDALKNKTYGEKKYDMVSNLFAEVILFSIVDHPEKQSHQ